MSTPANWRCPNCTLENLAGSSICEVCETQRPAAAAAAATPQPKQSAHNNNNNNNDPKTWKCLKCTFADNKESSLHCEVCQISNPSKISDICTEYVWEWSSGKNWHEYPQEMSDKIENAYFGGVMSIPWSLPHAEYVIDLTQLQQINQTTEKTRKIQRVRYEYEGPKSDNNGMNSRCDKSDAVAPANGKAEADDEKQEEEEEQQDTMNVDVNVTGDSQQWRCPLCTVLNEAQHLQCQVCCSERPLQASAASNNRNGSPMEVSGDERDQDNVQHKPYASQKKSAKQEKKDNVPLPITSLKKKHKRKLHEMFDDATIAPTSPESQPAKRQKTEDASNTTKMSEKNAGKQSGDSSVGAVLNADLISALWELSLTERNLGNVHKANAYSKACKELRTCGTKISSGKEAKDLQGIGVKIADKIDEMLQSGHIKKLDALRSDEMIQAINELCQVHGIGAAKSKELVKEYRIRSIAELRQHTDLLNNAQRIGLQYFEYTNARIPRQHCTQIGEIVRAAVTQIDARIIFDICGSYRRGKADCGDIDILLTHPAPKYEQKQNCKQLLQAVVSALKDRGLLVADLCHGPVQYMGICRHQVDGAGEKKDDEAIPADFTFNIPSSIDGDNMMITLNAGSSPPEQKERKEKGPQIYFRRIDLKFKPYKFYYANLLHFTGSDRFNAEIRKKAHEKNLILNEDGVFRMTDPDSDRSLKSAKPVIEPKSEKDIFEAIGMTYVEPQNRSW